MILRDNEFNSKRAIRINLSTNNHFFKGIYRIAGMIVGVKAGSIAVGESVWSGLKGVISQPVSEVKKKGAVGLLTVGWSHPIILQSITHVHHCRAH